MEDCRVSATDVAGVTCPCWWGVTCPPYSVGHHVLFWTQLQLGNQGCGVAGDRSTGPTAGNGLGLFQLQLGSVGSQDLGVASGCRTEPTGPMGIEDCVADLKGRRTRPTGVGGGVTNRKGRRTRPTGVGGCVADLRGRRTRPTGVTGGVIDRKAVTSSRLLSETV